MQADQRPQDGSPKHAMNPIVSCELHRHNRRRAGKPVTKKRRRYGAHPSRGAGSLSGVIAVERASGGKTTGTRYVILSGRALRWPRNTLNGVTAGTTWRERE